MSRWESDAELVIVPRTRDLGDGFTVKRALPSVQRRMVGPFIFFDQMGPVVLAPGKGMDVRPHPHIGLATVTYLFEGEVLHRDSLGSVQRIQPGAVNWMTAGSGIVHSERTPPELRQGGQRVFGIQIWVALPKTEEERAPEFFHHPKASLPSWEGDGKTLRLIAGSQWGRSSPVKTFSELFYADLALTPGARQQLLPEHEERALYLTEGTVQLEDGESFEPGQLVVLRPSAEVVLKAGPQGARLLLFGGASMDGPRHIQWNFVHSSRERIEHAKREWQAQRFPHVPEETEFIPLPKDEEPPPVRYP